jgi:arabinogalactan oligomer/maltooligosaccharide transport system substrate-binding protein
MNKRILAPLTVLLIASFLITSCRLGATPTPTPTMTEVPATETPTTTPTATPTPIPVPITFWDQDTQDADAVLDKLISDFQAADPNILVTRTHYQTVDLRLQFLSAANGNGAPDVIRMPNNFIAYFSQPGLIEPLDQLFDNDFLGQFLPGSLEAAKIGGMLWGIPDNYGNHMMLIYNKSLISTPPATFEDLITQAQDLTTKEVRGFAFNMTDPLWGVGFYGAFGGWPLDSNDKPQLSNQAFIDYLTFVAKLRSNGVVPKDCDYNCADTLMKTGKAAMIINGDWSLNEYAAVLGNNLGVAPVPPINGKTYTGMASGTYFMVSKAAADDPARKDAVVKFITFMTSADAQKQWLTQLKRLPSSAQVAQDPSISDDPILSGSMAALENARGLPAAPEIQCVWGAWIPSLQRVMRGSYYPSDAATSAQKNADACVKELSQPTATPPAPSPTP